MNSISGNIKEEATSDKSSSAILLLAVAAYLSISYSLYFTFMVVPSEKTMGAVQRIFYFHVGSAFTCYVAFLIVLICSLLYLGTRSIKADHLMAAAGEVGFVMCSVCLASGMIWGYTAWGTAFRLEPRLVATLVLWLIFLSFNILRAFGDPQKVRAHSAVLGILGAVTIPVVVFSIELLPQFAQLHPKVIEHGGLKSPLFSRGLLIASVALMMLMALLVAVRYRVSKIEWALGQRQS